MTKLPLDHLGKILYFFDRNRGVGHTKAASSNLNGIPYLVHSSRFSQDLKHFGVNAIPISAFEARGTRTPVAIDHYLTYLITAELLASRSKIQELEEQVLELQKKNLLLKIVIDQYQSSQSD